MPQIRVSQVAVLLGVSDDTVRRWANEGKLQLTQDAAGVAAVDGQLLARFAEELHASDPVESLDDGLGSRSARNHFTGIITRIISDTVMSQVDLQCGRSRVTSLISTEAVRDLGLEVGSIASAVVKATNVTVEVSR